MCRHLAWLGKPRTLASLLLEPPFGLLRQSYEPRRQAHGRLNADGWGVGWWSEAAAEPARWRSAKPMWADASLQSVAPHIPTSAAIAAVRCATVGMPLEETACSPFTRGRWLFSHNGRIDRSVLPTSAWRAADSVCDSAILAAWLLDDPDELAQRICKLGAADPKARLNVLLADGEQVLATVWGDTLAVRVDDSGVVVASEPYDDDAGWGEIPDRTLLTVSSDGVSLTDLEPM